MKRLWLYELPWILCCIMMLIMPFCFDGYGAEIPEDYQLVFDWEYYYDSNPDLKEAIGSDPEKLFWHFVTVGAREGRSGNEEFNLKAYVFHNKDLLNAFRTDWSKYGRHYVEQGKAEGRICTFQGNEGDLAGIYTTHYDPSIPRAVNVELAASRIDGVVLQPGEEFSFSTTVLSRIPENGYVLAPAIGGYEYGGGICQVSSTLYAAMCHGMVPALERSPHSSPVSYLPPGLDAVISEGHKDLRFVNMWDEQMTIRAEASNGNLTVFLWKGMIEEQKPEELEVRTKEQTEVLEEGQPRTENQS